MSPRGAHDLGDQQRQLDILLGLFFSFKVYEVLPLPILFPTLLCLEWFQEEMGKAPFFL